MKARHSMAMLGKQVIRNHRALLSSALVRRLPLGIAALMVLALAQGAAAPLPRVAGLETLRKALASHPQQQTVTAWHGESAGECQALFRDIRAGNEVNQLTVVGEAKAPGDPLLKELKHCDSIWSLDDQQDHPERIQGPTDVGETLWRVYRLPKKYARSHPNHRLLYTEYSDKSMSNHGAYAPSFQMIDVGRCEVVGSVPADTTNSKGVQAEGDQHRAVQFVVPLAYQGDPWVIQTNLVLMRSAPTAEEPQSLLVSAWRQGGPQGPDEFTTHCDSRLDVTTTYESK
jgi:hypothetical protein